MKMKKHDGGVSMWNPRSKLRCTVRNLLALSVTLFVVLGGSALGQEWTPDKDQVVKQPEPYSPYLDQHFPQQVLFGDTHFHSSLSMDSGLIGNRVGLDDALRFAKGEEIRTSTGQRARLIRPLDFLVLSDHAEYLGIADLLNTADPDLLATEVGRKWYEGMQAGGETAWYTAISIVDDPNKGIPRWQDAKVARSIWEQVVDIASKYNKPGAFTALNGYEWTSSAGGNNLHRVVVFRDGPDRVKQVLPFSAFDSLDPEGLWGFLSGYEEKTGGQVLAIPHNGNLSNGVMFAETVNGKAMTRDYAERRARWEPLMEVTQMKGDSEAHPLFSPEDEFADFETWDRSNINGAPKESSMLQYEYARSAFRKGLQLGQKLGVNPFKSGMIGSSDTHTSLSATREDNYFGKLPHYEPSAKRFEEVMLRKREDKSPVYYAWQLSASGLAAVWARENTREAIFDAMVRKEVYATTGSRITVRLFAGWDFEADEVERPDFADRGYSGGVPMGGDLTNGPDGNAPSFMIRAVRDPDNANLDRVQMIKGWLDGKETHERIYDVACADGRAIVDRRCEREVGSTVDIANASYTNTIGDPLLTAHWVDPDFDPAQRAFYYVRVIEIPKPRWTAYDAKFFNIDMPPEVPMTVQDRAYTSPIWYTP
jgi:hypothetical protein